MKRILVVFLSVCALSLSVASSRADLSPEVQAKVDVAIKDAQLWAADPEIVSAVKAQNASLPANYAELNQEKWVALTVLDPFIRGFSKNSAAAVLKAKKTDVIGEAFLSDANGCKVAFLTKTSNWSHKGKPKHDVPMTGKVWVGQIEMDASTGLSGVQFSVPVLDGGQPIGSLTVGVKVTQ